MMRQIPIKHISESLPQAAQAISYERAGGQKWVVKSPKHLEAERTLRGKLGTASEAPQETTQSKEAFVQQKRNMAKKHTAT